MSQITCLNCKQPLGCGCQRRVASDGSSACVSCLGQVERNILFLRARQTSNTTEQFRIQAILNQSAAEQV